jgi:hypothetical protein
MKHSRFGFREHIARSMASFQKSRLAKGAYPWDIAGSVVRNGVGMTSLPTLMRVMRQEGYLSSEKTTGHGVATTKFFLTREGAALARRSPAVEVVLKKSVK